MRFSNILRCLFLVWLPWLAALPVNGQEAPCIYLESITVTGRRITRDAVILRELSIRQGDCIPAESLEEIAEKNRLRLLSLGLFNEVKVSWAPAANGTVQLQIVVLDRFPVMPEPSLDFADRNFNVWWTEMNGDLRRINLGLTLNHNNFRGNRETVSVTGQAGYTQKAGFSYSRPFADKDQKHGFGISLYGLQNREIAYATLGNKLRFIRSDDNFMQRTLDAAVWYTYRPEYAVVHTLELSFHHYWISDTIASYMNPAYLGEGSRQEDVLRFSYRYLYNGVDNWNYPLAGHRFIGAFEQRLALHNGRWQSSVQLQYDRYADLGHKWYASLIFRGRASVPQRQPYIFRQNLGYGFNYIRGYEYYVIDGGSFGLLRANLKRELLNLKFRLPLKFFEVIPLRMYGKVYGDCGAAYNKFPLADNFSNRFLYSGGIGVDIVTLYDIKLRIEYTVNHLGEKALYLHRSGE